MPEPSNKTEDGKAILMPSADAASKGVSHHNMWWYPKRCEKEGCSAKENLLKCAGCSMVMYCGREHQADDWPTHKSDCKVFKRNKLKGFFYTDEEILSRFPFCPPGKAKKKNSPLARDSCPICCGTKSMTVTGCCKNPVCDTEHKYVVNSYSREFCPRSHGRYTLCGYHGVEKECDKSKDWRQCRNCVNRSVVDDKLWRGLNAYNFCPLLTKDVPRHSLCTMCTMCGKKYISGVEGSCSVAGGMEVCLACSESPLFAGVFKHTKMGFA